MKTKILKTMLYLSITSTIMKTPMSMMTLLLLQTMLSITLMNKMFNSSWFPMITFLMMIGGIMIIIMYMSMITSNKMFKTNIKIMVMMIFILTTIEEMMTEFQMNENQELIKTMEDLSMTKMYNKTLFLTVMMILYLLLTM